MEVRDYYSNKDNCIKDLALARKVWGSTKSTEQEWEGVERGLGFMVLYCPEELSGVVNAHFDEFVWRYARRIV